MIGAIRLTRHSRRLVMITAAVVMAIVAIASLSIWQLRNEAIAASVKTTNTVGFVIAEQTARTLQAVDLEIQSLSRRIATRRPGTGIVTPAELHARWGSEGNTNALQAQLRDVPQVESISFIAADGRVVLTTRSWPAPAMDLSETSFFHTLRQSPQSGLFISSLEPNPLTNENTVFVARPVTAPDGQFLGVTVASLRLAYFSTFFAAIGLEDGMGVVLQQRDGSVLVHYPTLPLTDGVRLAHGPQWDAAINQGGGSYRAPADANGLGARTVSAHWLAPFDLVVDVFTFDDAPLAAWRRQTWEISFAALAMIICLLLQLRVSMAPPGADVVTETLRRMTSKPRSEAKAEFDRETALLHTTLDHMGQGLLMVDERGIVAVSNAHAAALLDIPVGLLQAQPQYRDVVEFQRRAGEFDETAGELPEGVSAGVIPRQEQVVEWRRRNGVVLEIRSTPLHPGGMVRTFTDVTTRKIAEDMLTHAAKHDQLTGIANRAAFQEKLHKALARSQSRGRKMAVLCLDLDKFKPLNDTRGHAAGDAMLIEVAARMRESVRDRDIVARMGGDEFAILLTDLDEWTEIDSVAQRLLDVVRMPVMIEGEPAQVGVSIGIAAFPSDGTAGDELLRNADAALYKAKEAGRNTWRYCQDRPSTQNRSLKLLEQELCHALENRQFQLAYQPVFDTITGKPVAFQTLLRWNHPQRGLISSSEFIALAESSGLIVEIGNWVISTACAEAAKWAMPFRVEVRLSAAQLQDPTLLGHIKAVLSATGLAPQRLDLEMPGELLVSNPPGTIETMKALRATGVRLSMDDFGSEQSSVTYLRRFPLDQIKVEQSFVRSITTDAQASSILRSIQAIAGALDLDVVAEGIETDEAEATITRLRSGTIHNRLRTNPSTATMIRTQIQELSRKGDGARRNAS